MIVLAPAELQSQVASFLTARQRTSSPGDKVALPQPVNASGDCRRPAAAGGLSQSQEQARRILPAGSTANVGSPSSFQVVPLGSQDPQQFEAALERVFGPRCRRIGKTAQGQTAYEIRTLDGGQLSVSVDPLHRLVLVQGATSQVGKMVELVQTLLLSSGKASAPMALVALQRPRSGQLEQALSTLEQLSQGAAVSREHLASPEYSDPAAVAIRGPLSLTAGTQSPPRWLTCPRLLPPIC